MTDRLAEWEGRNPDGTPRAVLVKRDGLFAEILQEALRKLAKYEYLEDYVADQFPGDTYPSVKDMHDRAEAERQQRIIAEIEEEMMPMNKKKILQTAIGTYGADAQEKMLLEEMSELQKEICKQWRGRENRSQIAEEIADVEIMLEQMKMIFQCADAVSLYRIQKLKRLERRLSE